LAREHLDSILRTSRNALHATRTFREPDCIDLPNLRIMWVWMYILDRWMHQEDSRVADKETLPAVARINLGVGVTD
jgi:hypothetical protein